MRNTTRSPHGDRSLQRFLRRLAMSSLAGGLALMLAGPLSAQPVAQPQPAAQPQPDAAKQPVVKPPAPRPSADAKLRAQMAINKPLMTLAEDEALRKRILRTIRKTLRNGTLNANTRAAIDEWIEWRLYRMTITEIPKPPKPKKKPKPRKKPPMAFDPANPMSGMGLGAAVEPEEVPLAPLPYRRQLAKFNKDFLAEIREAAKSEINIQKAETFRRYVLDGIIKKSGDLFDNNFYVRLNVVYLLGQLNLDKGKLRGVGKVAYASVSAPLLEIIRDTEQHEALKIPAVLGLKRILLIGRAKRDLKNEIALELMAQLEQDASMYWYPMRLVETLGRVDEPLIQKTLPGGNKVVVQQPFHVQALTMVMRDPSRHWLVRSVAAKSLGRVSLHGNVNAALLAHEIVVLSSQMSAAYNKAPNQFYWHQSFFNAYLAFKPVSRTERQQILKVKPATLISKMPGQKSISDAYKQILPAVIHILQQPQGNVNRPIPDAAMQATTAWIGENKPSINRVAPGLPELEDPKPTAAKADAPPILPAAIARDN